MKLSTYFERARMFGYVLILIALTIVGYYVYSFFN
jgi:hypothetical protein